MTQMTDFDRLVTSWLEGAGPATMSNDAVEAALGVARRTTRRSRIESFLFGPAPWPRDHRSGFAGLPRSFRIAIVIGLLAVLAAGAIIVGSRLLRQDRPPETILVYEGEITEVAPAIGASGFDSPFTLPDGRIVGFDGARILAWDGDSGAFRHVGTLRAERAFPSAVVLADGQVLIVGGDQAPPDAAGEIYPGPATAEVWDPRGGTSSEQVALHASRWITGAVRLLDGRVLIAGGLTTDGSEELLATAELFDPATRTFVPTGSMTAPRLGHEMALLPDGRVVVVGGALGMAYETQTSTTEIYDPVSGTFSVGDPLDELVAHPDDSRYPLRARSPVVTLAGGELVVPGLRCQEVHAVRRDGTSDGARETPIERYDPITGRFSPAGTMPHCVHQALPLPNGELYVRGWWYLPSGAPVPWAGLYDPDTGGVRDVDPPTANGQPYINAAVQGDGSVLFFGSGVQVMR